MTIKVQGFISERELLMYINVIITKEDINIEFIIISFYYF